MTDRVAAGQACQRNPYRMTANHRRDGRHNAHGGHTCNRTRTLCDTEDQTDTVSQEHGRDHRGGIRTQQANDRITDAGRGDDRCERAACTGNQQNDACALERFTGRLLQIAAADVRQADQVCAQRAEQHCDQLIAQEGADDRRFFKHCAAQRTEQDADNRDDDGQQRHEHARLGLVRVFCLTVCDQLGCNRRALVDVRGIVPDTAVVNLNVDEVGHHNRDEANHNTNDQHDTQVKAENVGRCQRVGRGRYDTVRGRRTDGQTAGDVAHLHVDLGGNGNADRDEDNEGNVKEYRNGQDEACNAQAPDGTLLREGRNQLVGNHRRRTAVAHQLSEYRTKADGQTDTGHHIAEA